MRTANADRLKRAALRNRNADTLYLQLAARTPGIFSSRGFPDEHKTALLPFSLPPLLSPDRKHNSPVPSRTGQATARHNARRSPTHSAKKELQRHVLRPFRDESFLRAERSQRAPVLPSTPPRAARFLLTKVPLLMSLSARTIVTDGLIRLSRLSASPPMGSCRRKTTGGKHS